MITIEIFHTAFETKPRHVATLRSDGELDQGLDDAFTGTQNVESSWVEDKGQMGVQVTPSDEVVAAGRCRSTSVGDYARIFDAQGAESFWRCCSCGWKIITSREQLAMVGPPIIFASMTG